MITNKGHFMIFFLQKIIALLDLVTLHSGPCQIAFEINYIFEYDFIFHFIYLRNRSALAVNC